MRMIHTRKRIFKIDYAFENKFSLLVWVLSILKWKEYGYETVLYTDSTTLDAIKSFGFDKLYDEINTTLLEDKEVCKGIDFFLFWAMPKLLALKHEALTLGNDVVITDQDVVPMRDVSRMWTNSDVAVWSNKEFVEFKMIYPEIYNLSFPKGYKLPEWFTGKAKPLNTGIIHIKDKDIIKLFTDEALKMCVNNTNNKHNTNCQTMCNVEQRLLGEIVKHKRLSYSVMQPINEGLFNRNGFHTHGYKVVVKNNNSLEWNCALLKMINAINPEICYCLLQHELFKKEKECYNTITEIPKQLEQYL